MQCFQCHLPRSLMRILLCSHHLIASILCIYQLTSCTWMLMFNNTSIILTVPLISCCFLPNIIPIIIMIVWNCTVVTDSVWMQISIFHSCYPFNWQTKQKNKYNQASVSLRRIMQLNQFLRYLIDMILSVNIN